MAIGQERNVEAIFKLNEMHTQSNEHPSFFTTTYLLTDIAETGGERSSLLAHVKVNSSFDECGSLAPLSR